LSCNCQKGSLPVYAEAKKELVVRSILDEREDRGIE
jgi:hypothetical protein